MLPRVIRFCALSKPPQYTHLHSMNISMLASWRLDIECFSKIKHTISLNSKPLMKTLTKPAPRIYLWCRVVFCA